MLGALMRAFRQKLEDEMAHNRQVIADQDNKMQSLQARIEKKKFKSVQTKQLVAT